jgi:hypothetical protein
MYFTRLHINKKEKNHLTANVEFIYLEELSKIIIYVEDGRVYSKSDKKEKIKEHEDIFIHKLDYLMHEEDFKNHCEINDIIYINGNDTSCMGSPMPGYELERDEILSLDHQRIVLNETIKNISKFYISELCTECKTCSNLCNECIIKIIEKISLR